MAFREKVHKSWLSIREGVHGVSLEKCAHIAGTLGIVLGIVSLWFVYLELRHHTRVSMASNSQALVELTQPINLELAKNPELSILWERGLQAYDKLTPEEKPRYRRLWIMYLNVLENAYFQHNKKLIDDEFYAAWDHDLGTHNKALAKVWPELTNYFSKEFVEHVNDRLSAK